MIYSQYIYPTLEMKKTYAVIIEKAPEGGYIASVPALPGCMSQGENIDQALKNIEDAIYGYLECSDQDESIEKNSELFITMISLDINNVTKNSSSQTEKGH